MKMSDKDRTVSLTPGTWLVIFYIMKYSHFWKAPHWVFVTLWIIYGVRLFIEIIERKDEK